MRSRAVWWRMAWVAGFVAICMMTLTSCEWIGNLIRGDQPVAVGTVGSSGGSVEVSDPESELVGVRIDVPAGSMEAGSRIEILEISGNLESPTGYETDVFPAFSISSSVELTGAVTLTVPFPAETLAEGEELVLVHLSDSGVWGMEFPVLEDREAGTATFVLTHFSDAQLKKGVIKRPEDLRSVRIPGFDTELDSLCIRNSTTFFPQSNGECWAMCVWAHWYFAERPDGASQRLRSRFGSEEATQIAARLQDECEGQAIGTFLDSERKDIYQIIETMHRTGQPVVVGLSEGNLGRGAWHAVLAYEWNRDAGVLKCYDPNASIKHLDATQLDHAVIYKDGYDWVCETATWDTYKGVTKAIGLEEYRSTVERLFAEWNDTEIGIVLDDVGPEDDDLYVPGDEVQLRFSFGGQQHPIHPAVYVEVGPESQAEPFTNWITGYSAPIEELSTISLTITIPEDASPGRWGIRAEVRDHWYAQGEEWEGAFPIVYASTDDEEGVEGGWTHAFEVILAPETPTGLTASDGESLGTIALDWDDVEGAVLYKLFRSSTASGSYTEVYSGPDSDWEDADVRPGRSYFYQVEAWTDYLPSDVPSDAVEGTTAELLPPDNVQGAQGTFPDRYRISWDVDPEIDEYEVAQCRWATGNFLVMERRTTEGHWDQTVVSDDHYYYRVRAWYRGDCSDWSETVESWIDPEALVPDPPEGLSATQGDYASKIKLRWDTSDDGDLYRIERAGSRSGSYEVLDEVSDDPWEDLEPGPGETFWYRLSVKRDGQWSDPCDPVKGYTTDPEDPLPDPDPGTGGSSAVGFWSGTGDLSGTITARSGGYVDQQSLYGDLHMQHDVTGIIGSSVSGQWRFKPETNAIDDEMEDLYAVLDTFMPYTSGQYIGGRLVLVSEDSISEQATIEGQSIRFTLDARVAFTLNVNSSGHLVGSGDLNWTLNIRLPSTGESASATVSATISQIDMVRTSRSAPWAQNVFASQSSEAKWERAAAWCLRRLEGS